MEGMSPYSGGKLVDLGVITQLAGGMSRNPRTGRPSLPVTVELNTVDEESFIVELRPQRSDGPSLARAQ